jgi:hypothetical protein
VTARALASRVLAILGAFLLVAGILATYLREEVVDRATFVENATEALRSPEVRALVAEQVVVQIIDEGSTDLIAARPLVRPLVDALVATDTFADLFGVAAADAHRLLITRDDDVSFAVADAGTLAIEAVRAVAPGIAEQLPAAVDIDVVALRDTSLLAALSRTADRVRTLALVLPPVGVLLLLGAVALARDRRAALVRSGLAVGVLAGLGVAALAAWRAQLASGAVAPGELRDTDVRAAVDAAWGTFFDPLRTWLLVTGGGGLLVAGLAAGRVTTATLGTRIATAVRSVTVATAGPGGRVLRGAGFIGLGVVLLLQPGAAVTALALLVGGTLVYVGVGELATLLPDALTREVGTPLGDGAPAARRRARGPGGSRAAWAPWLAALAVVATGAGIAGALAGSDGVPRERASLEPSEPDAATVDGCNGSVELCDRRLDQVVFAGTHNSFSAALRPGWVFANQRVGIAQQLDDGIRFLMLDPHHGVRQDGSVRTDLSADGTDRNRVARELSPGALSAAERLAGRVGLGSSSRGARDVFLCHTLCELGAEPFVDELRVVRDFLRGRPGEVVVLAIEPFVSAQLVATAFRRAGLLDALAVLDRDSPMPTLRELVRRGDRVVVLTERGGGAYDWYHPMFSFTQDTPLSARRAGEFSCAPNRGESDSALFVLNHWIDRFPPPLRANRDVSTTAALRERVERCEAARGRTVNVIAVDFYDEGDVIDVVDELNARPPREPAETLPPGDAPDAPPTAG